MKLITVTDHTLQSHQVQLEEQHTKLTHHELSQKPILSFQIFVMAQKLNNSFNFSSPEYDQTWKLNATLHLPKLFYCQMISHWFSRNGDQSIPLAWDGKVNRVLQMESIMMWFEIENATQWWMSKVEWRAGWIVINSAKCKSWEDHRLMDDVGIRDSKR